MKKNILGLILFLGSPITLLASIWLKFVKQRGIGKISDKIFMKIGLLPLIDNYYEPLINPKKYLTKSLRKDRKLNGIKFNVEEQISLLSNFNFSKELLQFPIEKKKELYKKKRKKGEKRKEKIQKSINTRIISLD